MASIQPSRGCTCAGALYVRKYCRLATNSALTPPLLNKNSVLTLQLVFLSRIALLQLDSVLGNLFDCICILCGTTTFFFAFAG
uniref:Uncharacterized protein n=1 Tax=Oryza meridionalis TaxID=40149 RepID=A0A0E0CVI0_9ORYZ